MKNANIRRLGLAAIAVLAIAFTTMISAPTAGAEEQKRWEGSAALGFSLAKGNSDTLLFNSSIVTGRKWDKHELSLGADFTYGEQKVASGQRETTAESEHGFLDYKRLLGNDRVYGGARVDILHDGIADVEYRLTFGPFLGYYLIKEEKTGLSVEIGPSYVLEKLGSDSNNFLTMRVGERFDHSFNATARMWQSLEILPNVEDFDKYLLFAELGAETALTSSVNLRVVLQDKFDSQPSVGRKKNDILLITSLAYKF